MNLPLHSRRGHDGIDSGLLQVYGAVKLPIPIFVRVDGAADGSTGEGCTPVFHGLPRRDIANGGFQ